MGAGSYPGSLMFLNNVPEAMTAPLTVYFIDAFAEQVFQGNTAAVIITDAPLPDGLMQSIATQHKLSETAFLVKTAPAAYSIRWFSPITEIDFCGHATLASAYVLFRRHPHLQQVGMTADAVGRMAVQKTSDGYIEMDFPNRKPENISKPPQELLDALSIKPVEVLRNQQAYIVVCASEQDVLAAEKDNALLRQLAPFDVAVTAPSVEYDFVSRYFWPANGGDEDPVTGSIHTGLAPYWAEKLGKSELLARQVSARGGTLRCTVKGDRVLIAGKAVEYLRGTITLPQVWL